MKSLFSLILFVLILQFGTAQNFVLEPIPAEVDTVGVDLSVDYRNINNHAILSKITEGARGIGWQLRVVTAPDEWEFAVCDKKACYGKLLYTAPRAAEYDGNDEGILDIHAYPNMVPGCAEVELDVFPYDNPDSIITTGTYLFRINVNANCTTSTDNLADSKSVISPNPVSSLFTLQGIAHDISNIELYNINGQLVNRYESTQRTFDISGQRQGTYLLRYRNVNNQLNQVIKVVKID